MPTWLGPLIWTRRIPGCSPGALPARAAGHKKCGPSRGRLRVYALLFAGEQVAAASLVEEVQVVTEATGSRIAPYGDLCFAALRGREGEMSILATATKDEVVQRGEGLGIGLTDWATAVYSN